MDAELAEQKRREATSTMFDSTPDILRTMRRKQQVHNGDRSHKYIRRLDALTPTLSYSGWQDDARSIEWPTDYPRDWLPARPPMPCFLLAYLFTRARPSGSSAVPDRRPGSFGKDTFRTPTPARGSPVYSPRSN